MLGEIVFKSRFQRKQAHLTMNCYYFWFLLVKKKKKIGNNTELIATYFKVSEEFAQEHGRYKPVLGSARRIFMGSLRLF